jgi:hypothetical protein
MLPGYTAEASLARPNRSYRATAGGLGAAAGDGLRLAQSEVFCGVCALGGFGCGQVCKPCFFGLFDCCDSVCTKPTPPITARPGIEVLP